jgi:adenosylcobinamide-GDP ribazoletransferase
MKSFLAAMRFLTIAPVPGTWGTAEDELARSVPWFPIVGVLLGAGAAALTWLLTSAALVAVPHMVVAAVTVIVLLGFSGCLHIDGLADTADGFLSSRSRERVLEIMKDSHTGAMGVVAIVCVLLLKFASLASLASPASLSAAELWPAVLLMPLAGRCAIVVQMALLPYARSSGLGTIFYRGSQRWAAVWAMAVLAAVAWGILGWRGLIVWAACIVVAAVFSAYVYRKIGGATGDTLGAVCEIVEIVPALTLALMPLGGAR